MHPWAIDAFRAKVQRLTAEIEASSDEFQVTAPTDALATAASSSTAAARRLLLLGGEGGALLLAFTILAAAALRRDITDARRRLVWFGARRWQVELHTLTESLALGGGRHRRRLGRRRRRSPRSSPARAGSPVADVVDHALLSRGGLAGAAAIAVAAGLLLYATVRAPAVHLGRLAVTPLDAAALGAIAVVLVGWARGSVDSQQLAGGSGTSAFLLLVPALIVFAAAVIVGTAARAHPARARPRRPARADRAPARGRVARTQSGSRCDRGDVPRREPRTGALRSHVPLDARSAARQTRRASRYRRRSCCPEDLSQLVPVLHGAPLDRYPGTTTPVLRLSGNVPSGSDVRVSRRAGEPGRRCRRLAQGLRLAAALIAGGGDHAEARRRAALDANCPPDASSRCPSRRRATTSACERYSARGSATTKRSRSATRTAPRRLCCTAASRSSARRWRSSGSTS